MAPSQVVRVTMFKIPSEEDRKQLIGLYEVLKAEQKKDGKPYIVSLEAGSTKEDPRTQGYTFVSKTTFKDWVDHDFYDAECEAHKTLKSSVAAKGLKVEGLLTVFYEPAVVG